MAGERRTRAKTRENPSPGGFRSLDAEPRKSRKKVTRATAKRNAEAEQAQVQLEQQQRLPSPTPTASNSMVSADSRSVSEGDESRSTASPAPVPQEVKPTQKRAKTPVAAPSLLDTLEKEVDNQSTRTRSNKNRKRARAEDDTSNPDEAHEQHPAKRNRPSEPEMIQNNDKLMPHESVEQQAPGLQDDATDYASQDNDTEVQEEPDHQQTPTPLRYTPQVHHINGDETVQEKAPQYQTPAIEPDTPQIYSSNKEVVEEDDAPTPTPQRYTPQINHSNRVGAVQEESSLQGDDAHTLTPNDHTPQGDTNINGSKAIQQDNSRKAIDSPILALSSQQSSDKALATIPQGNNLATPAKASTEPEKSSLTTGGKRKFIRSRVIYEPKRMTMIPASVTRGPVWDSWVREEWAIYTKTPIGGFNRTRPAHKGFESLLKKGARGGIPVRRTWEQFEADTKKGVVLPLPSFELDNSNVTENEVNSEDEDHSALELSIMESPFRKDTPAHVSNPTAMAESHSSVRKEASSVNSKEIVAGSQSTLRQETLFGKPRKAAADPQHTMNEGASSGRTQKIPELESNTGSKEFVRTSSLRSSMTNSITPAPVPNPFASLRIEEHILTHPAMLEIVKVASQAFSADEGRLSKPIPDVAEFASFLDRYQRGGATFAHPLLIQDPADESMDAEAPVVMSDEESEVLDNLSEPRTPSPEPEAQPEQKGGWLDMLKTPFKFIAGGTKSAGNTPARNGGPVRRAGNTRPKSASRAHGNKKGPVRREQKKLQRPASASANTPFVSAPLDDPFKSSASPKERKWVPIEQRDRMDPKRIAEIQEIHRRQDEEKKREEDIHREERQKKRAIGLAKQGEWEVERMNETTGCLHVERYKMVNGKRKLLESRPKNDSFNCNFLDYSDSDSDDESEISENADSPPPATNANEPQRQSPPKERIFAPYRRSVGIKGVNSPEEPEEPIAPQEPEEQPEDRTRVRAYNGRIFKAQKYIQDNVNAGRHPLRSPKSPKTPTPAQPPGNIFSESTAQENEWTQSPPPAPKPGNATLPSLSQDEAAKAQKAREQAEKYKPKKSSRLCEVQHASPLHEKENLDPALMSLLNDDPLTWPGDAAVNEAVARIPDDDIITGLTTEDILEAHRQSNSIDHAVDTIFN